MRVEWGVAEEWYGRVWDIQVFVFALSHIRPSYLKRWSEGIFESEIRRLRGFRAEKLIGWEEGSDGESSAWVGDG